MDDARCKCDHPKSEHDKLGNFVYCKGVYTTSIQYSASFAIRKVNCDCKFMVKEVRG